MGKLEFRMNPLPTLARDTSFGFTGSNAWQAFYPPRMVRSGLPRSGHFQQQCYIVFPWGIREFPFSRQTNGAEPNTFYDDADSLLWVGADSGLIKKNKVFQTEFVYRHDLKNPYTIQPNNPYL